MSKNDSVSETVTQTTRFLLTSSNYTIWVLPMSAKLEDIGIRTYVTGVLKTDEKTSADELAQIEKLNVKAYSMIIQNLDSENLALVSTTLPPSDHFDGKALWSLLRRKYAGSDLAARSVALDVFLDLEYEDVSTFCNSIRLANQKLLLAGIMLDDQVKMMIMLRKLPREDFRSFRDIVAMGFSTESFEAIVKRLESYSVTNKISKDNKKSSIEPRMTLHTLAQPSSQPSDPTPSVSPVCVHCKKTGHRPTNCWVKYPEKAPKSPHSSHYTHYIHASGELRPIDEHCPQEVRF
ncbi:hypothetical protein PGT21_050334 [Puccinia graminis f. sp. tritici]|uniref:CCHC-type domain-containing protein n=1 Tax=Puccinia graminis f. sp. tritici TaxID=56615 RepID=A0A5B0MUW1_PUCGR|nr:hypothetical protein PGT21_050334 [Puccinia graminis f. sp. tritici]KAA1079924.1 hypothetical protein PGTUg99_050069 [Puccinia graminis f. sp. tritici]